MTYLANILYNFKAEEIFPDILHYLAGKQEVAVVLLPLIKKTISYVESKFC